MQNIKLNNRLSLNIEDDPAGLRIVVADDNGNEIVCHKITKAKLKVFLNEDDSHLFKGRLQLIRTGDNISVRVKGEIVGKLVVSDIDSLVRD